MAASEVRDEVVVRCGRTGGEDPRCREAAQVSLDGIAIETVPHAHAAAERAVDFAVSSKVTVLVNVHTDKLMGAVVASSSGLRTERRISHIYAMDVPAYPRPLLLPMQQSTSSRHSGKTQNLSECGRPYKKLGMKNPLVVVLAAVEMIDSKMPATLDAARYGLAARAQITGAKVDGPLAFDNAINPDAARKKGIISPVAGYADILLAPMLRPATCCLSN